MPKVVTEFQTFPGRDLLEVWGYKKKPILMEVQIRECWRWSILLIVENSIYLPSELSKGGAARLSVLRSICLHARSLDGAVFVDILLSRKYENIAASNGPEKYPVPRTKPPSSCTVMVPINNIIRPSFFLEFPLLMS